MKPRLGTEASVSVFRSLANVMSSNPAHGDYFIMRFLAILNEIIKTVTIKIIVTSTNIKRLKISILCYK